MYDSLTINSRDVKRNSIIRNSFQNSKFGFYFCKPNFEFEILLQFHCKANQNVQKDMEYSIFLACLKWDTVLENKNKNGGSRWHCNRFSICLLFQYILYFSILLNLNFNKMRMLYLLLQIIFQITSQYLIFIICLILYLKPKFDSNSDF